MFVIVQTNQRSQIKLLNKHGEKKIAQNSIILPMFVSQSCVSYFYSDGNTPRAVKMLID